MSTWEAIAEKIRAKYNFFFLISITRNPLGLHSYILCQWKELIIAQQEEYKLGWKGVLQPNKGVKAAT